jgi:hypothetical protein
MHRLVVLVLFATVALPTAALAHASYKSSDPANRSTVATAPASISAEFTEPLASGSYLQVFDPCGDQVDNGDTEISGYTMSVTQGSSRAGTFTVRFRALSTLDPHEVNGSFSFTATGGEPCPGAEPPADEKSETAEKSETVEDAERDQPVVAADDGDPEQQGSADASEGDRKEGRESNAKPLRKKDERKAKTRVLAQRRERDQRGLFDDMPIGSFAISLAISALIGAAGGKVYAGIMGPRA